MAANVLQLILRSTLLGAAGLAALYYGSFLIMPSVMVVNQSSANLTQSVVNLPRSRLDFGLILANKSNRIYYSLTQSDGLYEYYFVLSDNTALKGQCGSVTNNEIGKRVVITVFDDSARCEKK